MTTNPEAQVTQALLPCPVCGDQPKWRGTRSDYARGIYRLQCLGETHLLQAYGPSETACVRNWNTRPLSDVEALREALEQADYALSVAVNDTPPSRLRDYLKGEHDKTRTALASVSGGWRDIADASKDGTRINLCWKSFGGLSAHVELGKWSPSNGWCNTYGKPFSSEPDFYQRLPEPPAAPSKEDGRDG